MKLKNDKERIAFLEERREEDGWFLWINDPGLGRRFWRYDDEKDGSIIVEERLQTITYPKTEMKWIERNWYLFDGESWGLPFEDRKASRTLALQYIKTLDEFKR